MKQDQVSNINGLDSSFRYHLTVLLIPLDKHYIRKTSILQQVETICGVANHPMGLHVEYVCIITLIYKTQLHAAIN